MLLIAHCSIERNTMTNHDAVYEITDLKLDNYNLLLNETLFHNANGYIGIRYSFEEGYLEDYHTVHGQYINGFYDYAKMEQAERLYGLVSEKQTMLNIAETQSLKIFIDDEEFSIELRKIVRLSMVHLILHRSLLNRI